MVLLSAQGDRRRERGRVIQHLSSADCNKTPQESQSCIGAQCEGIQLSIFANSSALAPTKDGNNMSHISAIGKCLRFESKQRLSPAWDVGQPLFRTRISRWCYIMITKGVGSIFGLLGGIMLLSLSSCTAITNIDLLIECWWLATGAMIELLWHYSITSVNYCVPSSKKKNIHALVCPHNQVSSLVLRQSKCKGAVS